MGFCPQCRSSGSLEEVVSTSGRAIEPVSLAGIGTISDGHRPTSIGEFDRVLGGGLVPGSVILVGGEPGVGKSTLLLHVADAVAAGAAVLLASAEESTAQVALRAARLGIRRPGVKVVAETDVEAIIAAAAMLRPALLIVDSIQTVATADADGGVGGVAQVRESAARFVAFAKQTGIVVVLVGHVTKEGSLAGPKLLEHMVDVVLQLEGDAEGGLRLLRSLKNRFGSVRQVGVFSMTDTGLDEVSDPSRALVSRYSLDAAGTVLFPSVAGRRSMLVEVQALAVASPSSPPRRSVKGVEAARVHQLIAVLQRHGGVGLAGAEVHVNIVGGIRISDPAVDLPIALAIASSHLDRPLRGVAAWGEIGLAGEVRPVVDSDQRRREAERFDPRMVVAPGDPGVRSIRQALFAADLGGARRGSKRRPGEIGLTALVDETTRSA